MRFRNTNDSSGLEWRCYLYKWWHWIWLFQYYIGYSGSSGILTSCPYSMADINDNDNFHQLCFSTSDEIVKISMMANTVEDKPRPQWYSEIDWILYAFDKYWGELCRRRVYLPKSVFWWNFYWAPYWWWILCHVRLFRAKNYGRNLFRINKNSRNRLRNLPYNHPKQKSSDNLQVD